MASDSKELVVEDEVSSDDEVLSVVKRKTSEKFPENEKKIKYEYDDDVPLLPEVLVRVEVEEMDESHCTWNRSPKEDFTNSEVNKKKSKSKRKKTHRCSICNVVYECAGDLRNHLLEHQVETRHKCEHCGRCFSKAFSLKMHKRIHIEKEEKCPLCDLTFTLKINLGRHLMSHERTEECDKCPAKFHTKEQLDEHVVIHSRLRCVKQQYQYNTNSQPTSMEHQGNVNTSASSVRGASSQASYEVQIKNEVESDDNNEEEKSPEKSPPSVDHSDNFLKREDLSHQTQVAIVSKMHKGRSVPDICRLYNVTAEVVNEIWEDRDKYMLTKKTGTRTTKYMNNVLDKRILDWYSNKRSNGVQVSGKMLQDEAEALAKECGFVAFNGSKKWLDRFKKRHQITFRATQTKRDYHSVVLEAKWKKQFLKEQWCDIRLGFADEDIYVGDEVGLFYNPSKGRIRKLAGKKYIHGYPKDRLSIFICTNATGSDKKKLLVCGTEDPLKHSYRDQDTLPVTYIRHPEAHFTTPMFEEYVKYWNRELQLTNRTALLILDRATIHSKLQLSHLKLVFVPWKASNSLIPIKFGIFNRFRDEFRKLILEEKAMNALRGVDRNLTCLEALNMLQKSWERTPCELMTKCFIASGYDIQDIHQDKASVQSPKFLENDEEILCEMLKDYDVESYFTELPSLDMYLTVEEEHLTGQGTNCSVFGGNHKVTDPTKGIHKEMQEILPLSTELPESDQTEIDIKRARALEDLEIVRKFLQANKTSYETYSAFMDIENYFIKNSDLNSNDD